MENKNRNCEVDINLCTFFWTGQSKIDFIDNYANSGPMIYGGMMDGCTHLQNNSSTIPLVDVISDNGRPLWSKLMVYLQRVSNFAIVKITVLIVV